MAMRRLLAVVLLICYITLMKTTESEEREEAVENKCKAKHNVDESIFIDDNPGDEVIFILKDESNENHRCYVECLMEGFGYIKDGELDQKLVMDEVLEDLKGKNVEAEREKLRQDIEMCAHKDGEGKCNRAYQIAKCFFSVTE